MTTYDDEFGIAIDPCEHASVTGTRCETCGESVVRPANDVRVIVSFRPDTDPAVVRSVQESARAFARSMVAMLDRKGVLPPKEGQVGDVRQDVCQRCGGANVVWFAPNKVWNEAMPREGVVCPSCFVLAHEAATGRLNVWRLEPNDDGVSALDAAWVTVAMVAGATGISLRHAKRLLDEMVSDGRAEVVVRKRRRYYRLTEGGAG